MNKVITEAIQIYAHRRALRGATTNFDGYKLTVVREQTRDHLEAWHAMLRSSPADVTAEDLVQYMEAGTVPQERPVVGCEDCYWQVNHGLSRCPYADEPITAEEAAAIDAERSARRS